MYVCDPLSENLALRANIEFELEAILSMQVVFQLRLLHQCVTGGLDCIILNYEQCVPGSLPSSPAQEPGNDAKRSINLDYLK